MMGFHVPERCFARQVCDISVCITLRVADLTRGLCACASSFLLCMHGPAPEFPCSSVCVAEHPSTLPASRACHVSHPHSLLQMQAVARVERAWVLRSGAVALCICSDPMHALLLIGPQ